MTPVRSVDVGEAAVDLTIELVQIDSVNPGLVPGAAGEGAMVEFLAARLTAQGFVVETVEASGREARPSLIATHAGSGGGRSVVLNGHLDTVGVEGMTDPFVARMDGDRRTGVLYGRGACDMKAGIAAMVVAAETVAANGAAGDVILALVADEEHASCGTEAVLERLAGDMPDACLIGEPTGLDLAAAHRGYAVIEVEFTGVPAHSAQPELGVNAVAHLGRLLAAVAHRGAELAAGPGHPIAGCGSMMATVAAGGLSPFLIPAAASAVIERRTVPGEPVDSGLAEVQAMLEVMHLDDPTVDATATEVLCRDAWQFDAQSEAGAGLAVALSEALEGSSGRTPDRVAFPYWMESALWEAAGVPTVVCGPAGGGLHAEQEWVELAQVRAYTHGLVEALHEFCGSSSSGG